MTPLPGISLYPGRTVHQRFTPFEHRLVYPITPFLFDLERLDAAAEQSRWFSRNRFNLFSFHDRDYGRRDGSDPQIWARETLSGAGVDLEGGRLSLLCFPHVLNYVFNPLSLWFGYGPDGDLRGLIYEVHNTFGQAHSYVAPVIESGRQQHQSEKVFHVSPFFPVAGEYAFDLTPPGEKLSVSIQKTLDGQPSLTAAMALRRHPATDTALLKRFARTPFMTVGVITAIHWEALKLKLKGARYHSPPEPPARATLANPKRSTS